MKKLLTLVLAVFSGIACSKTPGVDDFQALSEKACVPLSASPVKLNLPAEWQPYLSFIRVCPLTKKVGDKPAIVLTSIFIEDFYRNKPMDAEWSNFPKPVFFNTNGQCVARLPDLYPSEPPRDLEISYGHWQGNIPGEIRTHVLNPAVGGDFDLPVLRWDAAKQHYIPVGESPGGKKLRMECA
jgi:hypothetical protein